MAWGAALALWPAAASAQPAAERYAACSPAETEGNRRIAEICDLVDDIHARLRTRDPGRHLRRWADLHYALGSALFVIGAEGDAAALRDSIVASRVAADYFTRERTPTRWGAIQMSIANALQLLGDGASVAEAVDVARAAVAAIDRPSQPELWASAQASLGHALRMRAHRTGDREALIEAAEAVRGALEIYRRPAFAEERARAERLLESILNDLAGREPGKT
jgi:hypothetical protein